jgi:hypothetical protein
MDQKPEGPENNNKSNYAFLWLIVGLAPIGILLFVLPANGGRPSIDPGLLLLFCIICNLMGGIGCLGGVKDAGTRIGLGLLLAGFFFVLTLGVVLFQACSHMNM